VITFLFVLAFLAGVIGLFLLSEATVGVGIIALGCLAGILTRILQADRHQDEILPLLRPMPEPKEDAAHTPSITYHR
jgi:hypothetical protein